MCVAIEEKESKVVYRKYDVAVSPVWIGKRLSNNFDLHEFEKTYYNFPEFPHYPIVAYPNINPGQVNGTSYSSEAKALMKDINNILDLARKQVAIFYIISAEVAESHWFPIMKKLIAKHRLDFFSYTIVVGDGFKREALKADSKDSLYNPYEIRAHELDAVNLPFGTDVPIVDMRRVTSMIERIVGVDLPGLIYPDYNQEDLQRLAWHISRENFNFGQVKEGSIPKYRIDERGRPEILRWGE